MIVFGVIYLSATKLINLNPNFASPNKFVVADDFDVSINSTSIKYDEAESSDNILINLNVKNNSDAAYHLISCFFINASQDSSKILTEPNENVRNDGIENNTTALGQVIDSGESMELLFAFKLADYSDVRLSFTGFGLDDQPQEPIVVVMPVHKSINVWWNEICKW